MGPDFERSSQLGRGGLGAYEQRNVTSPGASGQQDATALVGERDPCSFGQLRGDDRRLGRAAQRREGEELSAQRAEQLRRVSR